MTRRARNANRLHMDTIDLEDLAAILRDAAKAEILPRFRRLDPETVKTKTNPTDLVTEADTESERRIAAEICRRWPRALVVGDRISPARLARVFGQLGRARTGRRINKIEFDKLPENPGVIHQTFEGCKIILITREIAPHHLR